MKEWISKSIKILRSPKGETLMESIVSLLILSILLLAVTIMIETSLRMTSFFTQKAREMQEDTMNSVIWTDCDGGVFYDECESASITFEYTINGVAKSASHEVEYNTKDDVIAFAPAKQP